MNKTVQSIKQYLKIIIAFVLLIGIILSMYALFSWTGVIICLVILAIIIILVFFFSSVYGFVMAFSYSDKEIGIIIKNFLEYDFGDEYDVIVNETRVHGDFPVRFVIKIPQDTMQDVMEYCKSSKKGKCTTEEYYKTKEYNSGNYVERREHLTIKFDECTIEFSGISY